MASIRERRDALGWSRKQLGAAAGVDTSVLQLIELGQWTDPEPNEKVEAALTAEEQRRAAGSTGDA